MSRDFPAELARIDGWLEKDRAAVAKWERLGMAYEAKTAREALRAHLELRQRVEETSRVQPLIDAGEELPDWYKRSS